MATVFKKTFTKPLPDGAETFTRKGEGFARWKDAKGKTRTEKLTTGQDGALRLLIEAKTFTAKFRDGAGIVREVSTGCHDETAARQVLADLSKRAEIVKSGVLTAAQDATIDYMALPLEKHLDAYLGHLAGRATAEHVGNVDRALRRVVADCGFARLANLDRGAVETWLNRQKAGGMGARTRNTYRAALVAFGNWCVSERRLAVNPLAAVVKGDEKADCRRRRRALTEDELAKLLDVAQRRPLIDAQTVRRGKHKGEQIADLRPETVARLEALGRERALTYKALVLTGLRKGELASLTVGQVELAGPTPYAQLRAADEKNRQGNRIPLRPDLAADLRALLAGRLAEAQAEARRQGKPLPMSLPADEPLLNVPKALVLILDRDLVAAGLARRVKDEKTGKVRIDKTDSRGWTIDVHALRHTFATLLNKRGVAPRTAQAAMRHSTLALTMNTYTDPKLLDVAGAMDALPALPLDGPKDKRQKATGTFGKAGPLAPTLAPTLAHSGASVAQHGTGGGQGFGQAPAGAFAQVSGFAKETGPLANHAYGPGTAGDGSRTHNNQLGRLEL